MRDVPEAERAWLENVRIRRQSEDLNEQITDANDLGDLPKETQEERSSLPDGEELIKASPTLQSQIQEIMSILAQIDPDGKHKGARDFHRDLAPSLQTLEDATDRAIRDYLVGQLDAKLEEAESAAETDFSVQTARSEVADTDR